MSQSRIDLIDKIDSQRATIRLHIDKYVQFKKNGDYTSSAEDTISRAQSTIRDLKAKDSSISSSWEDVCGPDGR
jgi:hypothetical protein